MTFLEMARCAELLNKMADRLEQNPQPVTPILTFKMGVRRLNNALAPSFRSNSPRRVQEVK